jgi:hypothetical protein
MRSNADGGGRRGCRLVVRLRAGDRAAVRPAGRLVEPRERPDAVREREPLPDVRVAMLSA